MPVALDQFLAPTDDEVLFGYPLRDRRPTALPHRRERDPAAALIDVVATLLDSSDPTLVEFSGGIDSSLVLSAATVAARRAGRPDPVPVTYRYTDAPATDEAAFQEVVVRSLNLREWRVFQLTDEHDVVGPNALELLSEIGPILPGVLAGKAWSLAQLRGRSMLNGEGGDAVLGSRRITSSRVFLRHLRHGELRPAVRRGRSLLRDLGPRPVRTRLIAADIRRQYGPPWLDEALRRDLSLLSSPEDAAEPLDPRRYFEYYLSLPGVWVPQHNARLVRAHFGVTLHSPLLHPDFVAVLAATVPRSRWINRSELIARYFTSLLPAEIIERRSKAEFSDAYFAAHTRRFGRVWDGRGVPDRVDARWLKEHWSSADRIHGGSTILLQRAALTAASGDRS
ncbi:MAG: asparagine synthase-related protein [Acidimicrobiia bacterium]